MIYFLVAFAVSVGLCLVVASVAVVLFLWRIYPAVLMMWVVLSRLLSPWCDDYDAELRGRLASGKLKTQDHIRVHRCLRAFLEGIERDWSRRLNALDRNWRA